MSRYMWSPKSFASLSRLVLYDRHPAKEHANAIAQVRNSNCFTRLVLRCQTTRLFDLFDQGLDLFLRRNLVTQILSRTLLEIFWRKRFIIFRSVPGAGISKLANSYFAEPSYFVFRLQICG